jgi:RNA polymerase sigma-70 factor (ECF subfamily)
MEDPAIRERWERLAALLRPVHDQAFVTARRLGRSAADGEDLYQDTVIRAFEKLDTLREPSKFRAWFYTTLLNVHRSRYRRRFWKRFVALEELPREHDPAGEDGRAWESEIARADRASRALQTLGPPEREAVVLFEIEGFSIDEIARMQRASVAAVKSRLVRGRARLRRFYERHGGNPKVSLNQNPEASLEATPPSAARIERRNSSREAGAAS